MVKVTDTCMDLKVSIILHQGNGKMSSGLDRYYLDLFCNKDQIKAFSQSKSDIHIISYHNIRSFQCKTPSRESLPGRFITVL